MKNVLKHYTSFTRTERYGILALLLLCLCLVAVKLTMHYWVGTQPASVEKLDLSTVIDRPLEGKVDINTVDSLTLIKIKGIGPGLSHRILERRRTLGRFTDMQQVLDVYKFSPETKATLVETLIIK
ncbi:MAG: helix-hairpin-helix domain-containing protein [Chitinophagales bacterium]|nr:helix-hairpin-helix domain-containing protein [Chitinophagaceae bacterium]MCB9063512.1 helix-hairpin-helix domain-containing protein [Chitinophagales bacterium]